MIPRVIPCLLLKGSCLYKTVRFCKPVYVGDAVNAVRIFNEKEVDELLFVDFRASKEGRPPDLDVLRDISGECFMPLAYGGGITDLGQIERILGAGAEKVVICSAIAGNAGLIGDAARSFGSQAIVASIDYKTDFRGKLRAYVKSGTKKIGDDVIEYARRLQDYGAGEILLNSIDRDGRQVGFDLDTIRRVSEPLEVPVVACGGAGSLSDLRAAIESGAAAVAAGSLFVFHGRHRAVLITYPERGVLENLFSRRAEKA